MKELELTALEFVGIVSAVVFSVALQFIWNAF